jgi:hypothetical protein
MGNCHAPRLRPEPDCDAAGRQEHGREPRRSFAAWAPTLCADVPSVSRPGERAATPCAAEASALCYGPQHRLAWRSRAAAQSALRAARHLCRTPHPAVLAVDAPSGGVSPARAPSPPEPCPAPGSPQRRGRPPLTLEGARARRNRARQQSVQRQPLPVSRAPASVAATRTHYRGPPPGARCTRLSSTRARRWRSVRPRGASSTPPIGRRSAASLAPGSARRGAPGGRTSPRRAAGRLRGTGGTGSPRPRRSGVASHLRHEPHSEWLQPPAPTCRWHGALAARGARPHSPVAAADRGGAARGGGGRPREPVI